MSRKCLPLLVVFGLLAGPALARAAEAEPSVLVHVKPADELIASAVKFAGAFTDKDKASEAIHKAIKDRLGPKGLKGLDTKRPLGLYGDLTADFISSPVVVLVPITDEDAFLDLLARLQLQVEKEKDGIYKFQAPGNPFPNFMRFAHKYAYITVRSTDAIAEDKLREPATVLSAGEKALVALTVRIDRLPDELKQKAIEGMKHETAKDLEQKKPGETAAQFAFREQFSKYLLQHITMVLEDGSAAVVRLDDQLGLDFQMTAKPKSRLAAEVAALANMESRFAGLRTRNAIVSMGLHLTLPAELRKTLGALMDESIREGLDKEKDEAKRAIQEELARAIAPTLKSGKIDGAFEIRRPPKAERAVLVGGITLSDGTALERALRAAVKKLPADQQKMIQLDAESVGSIKIHRLDPGFLPAKDEKEKKEREQMFGNHPGYLAILPDAALLSVGENSLAELKEALTARPRTALPFYFELSFARLAELPLDDAGKNKEFDKSLAPIGMTVHGGHSLKIRVDGMGAAVATLFVIRKTAVTPPPIESKPTEAPAKPRKP